MFQELAGIPLPGESAGASLKQRYAAGRAIRVTTTPRRICRGLIEATTLRRA